MMSDTKPDATAMTRHQDRARGRDGDAAGAPPLGRRYEVSGHRLLLHKSPGGGPAVVFLPAASNVGLDYLNVHDQISGFATSVLYDRGGTGWSDRLDLPRTGAEVATELHDLLAVAGVPGPYLLVAHSLGGGYARRFGQLYPGDVAGVLALDAFHEDWDSYLPEILHLDRARQPQPGRFQYRLIRPIIARMYRRMLASWPAGLREQLIAGHLSYDWFMAGAHERASMVALRDELKLGGPAPDVPTIVLTGLAADQGQSMLMSKKALRAMHDGKLRLDEAQARAVTVGEHRVLADARHSTMQIDRPDAVVTAIRDLLDRVRN
jgi:pimeloyl-ACP methyl ester carboxylesterase